MTELRGAILENDNCLRIIPHGRLHDQYQRGEYLTPPMLSYAAAIINERGGIGFSVDSDIDRLLCLEGKVFVARCKPYLDSSPYLLTPEPVPWEDIPWLLRECELTVLHWIRRRNELPDESLMLWLAKRDAEHIRRIGRKEYEKQYRKFWNRDLPI